MGVFDFDRAIVRSPSADVVDGLRSGEGPSPSFDGIVAEHRAYVAALEQAGLEVTILDPLPGFPDSIFVEDPALVFPEGAILLRPGAPTRAGECAHLESALRAWFDTVLVLPDGHADGGDILVTPEIVYIGLSARTDVTGAEALRGLLARLGRQAIVVRPPAGTLHLKSASSLIAEDCILATAALAKSALFDEFDVLVVPEGEEGAANALRLNSTILAGSAYPRTLDLLSGEGLDLVPLEVSEIARIDAGLSCMSLRWSTAG
jgi:dimethylargininase